MSPQFFWTLISLSVIYRFDSLRMPLNLSLRVGRKLESVEEILEPFSAQRVGLAASGFNFRLCRCYSLGSRYSLVAHESAGHRYFFP
ncbi:MAG: hypothetical protein QG577_459 [Thermodesulfobacteriota bacterium]|nr:hypothetical protein [Thermodesulfobacteriota bacterium]